MKKLMEKEANNVMKLTCHFPAVSMIMPFNPKMGAKKAINNSLNIESGKIEIELHEYFPEEMSRLVMQKLHAVLSKLDYSTHSTAIAIFISPVFEKLLYLNFPVEKIIVVDESFEIRDLVFCKKESHEYLALLLGKEACTVYLGSPGSFVKILSNTPKNTPIGHPATLVETGPGLSKTEDIKTKNYLHYTDNVLDVILRAYPLPLFVLGNPTISSYFKGLTKHAAAVINYLEGNFEKTNAEQLNNLLQPQVADWRKVKEKRLLNQLEKAYSNKQLVTGINDVWCEAMSRGGHLLVFEKGRLYSINNSCTDKVINEALKPYNSFSCIKDQLDEAIGRVLENGGNVEFVDEDVLKAYDHIALLRYQTHYDIGFHSHIHQKENDNC